LEKARGNLQQNKEYCSKEDPNPFETGTPMSQGRRNDLEDIKSLLDAGATPIEIADTHFSKWVVYRRSFEAYATRFSTPRNWKTKVMVLWGKTGTGKTRYCHDQVMNSQFWSPGDFQWFDGYNGQPIVIIDDFRGEYPLPLLLKLLDRYPMRVPIKGGFVNWCPRKVYITSNVDPNWWYKEADSMSNDALQRRLDHIDLIEDSLY
jgi:hypothetical protein